MHPVNAAPDQVCAPSPAVKARLTRRQWLKGTVAGCAVLGLGIIVDTVWIEPHWVDVVQRELPVVRLPEHWQGRTVVQLSDIHVGPRVSDDYLIRSFERTAELQPDVVVFTGDFLTANPEGTMDERQFRRVYEQLPRGRMATVGILGNHDYGGRWSNQRYASEITDILGPLGLRILRNESVELDGFEIVGIDDLWSGRCDVPASLAASAARNARLVLCHNPDTVDLDSWSGYRGWILAGHTHGGQCKPPFLPPPVLPVENRRYTAGEFDLYDGRRLYINRGLGHLLPVRFNARPEITVFRLTEATA